MTSKARLSWMPGLTVKAAAAIHAPSFEPPTNTSTVSAVRISATLSVSLDAWASLQAALHCWETLGSWVEVETGHWKWTPDAKACPPYHDIPSEHAPGGLIACALMQSLAELIPAPLEGGYGATSTAAFIGDSLTEQYFRTCVGWPSPREFSKRVSAPVHTAGATVSGLVTLRPVSGVGPDSAHHQQRRLPQESRLQRGENSPDAPNEVSATGSRALARIRFPGRPANGICNNSNPMRIDTPLPGCRASASGGSVSAHYRRSDRLYLDGDPRAQCFWTANFVDGPWSSAEAAEADGAQVVLSPATRLVVLNRGAHVENDALTLEGWTAALREARRVAPHALIVAHTTPHRHKNCSAYDRPVASPPHPSPFGVSKVFFRGCRSASTSPASPLRRPRTPSCALSSPATSQACCCSTSRGSLRCGPTRTVADQTACTGATCGRAGSGSRR